MTTLSLSMGATRDTECNVESDASGGYHVNFLYWLVSHLHDGAFAKVFLYLGHSHLQGFQFFVARSFGNGSFLCHIMCVLSVLLPWGEGGGDVCFGLWLLVVVLRRNGAYLHNGVHCLVERWDGQVFKRAVEVESSSEDVGARQSFE